jgi:hypothetical protein
MCAAPESVTLVAYDLRSGEYRWHRCGTGVWYALRAVADDTVYVSDIEAASQVVVALDAATGDERGSVTMTQLSDELPGDAALPMATPPELAGLRLAGGQDDPLVVWDSATGERLWSVKDFLAYDDVWAVGDGAVYMAHVDPADMTRSNWTVRSYDLRTGDVLWEADPGAESYPWWVADGRVFSIWTDITVFSAATGEVLWATDYDTADFPGMRGVLANDDTVFVTFASHWGGGD